MDNNNNTIFKESLVQTNYKKYLNETFFNWVTSTFNIFLVVEQLCKHCYVIVADL